MRRDTKSLGSLNLDSVTIIGWEDDNEDDDDKNSSDGSDDSDDDDNDKDDDEDDKDDSKTPDVTGLKKALRAERKQRRGFEKRLKAFEKANKDSSDQEASDLEKANKERDSAAAIVDRLGDQLATQAIDMSIQSAATKLKFLDPDDALRLVDRDAIDVDQDEDDLSKVTIDGDSVKEALEALAKDKPHLLMTEEESGSGGGKFGGSRGAKGKTSRQAQEQEDSARYPAMRNRRSNEQQQ